METNNKKLSGLKLNNAAKFMYGLIIFILAVDYAIISVSAIECDTGSVIVVSVLDNDGVTVSGAFVSASFNGSVIDAGTTNNNGEIAFTIPMGNFPDDITPIDVNITASVNGYCGSAIKTIACGTPPDVTETTINLNHPCVSNSTENEKCVVPEDNFYVNEDTLLCGGVYNILDYNAQEVIIINASDVVLDCNGATLKGTGSGSGIDVSSKNNVTIKNCNIEGYEYSIYEYMSQNSIINNNNLSGNSYGIGIFYFNNTNISGNLIKWNFPNGGIYMSNSNLGAINENIIYGNDNGIYLTNSQNTELNGNIVCGNYNIDFSLTNSSGTGNNNTCDTGNWNDTLKDGCSYSCLEGLAITINETTDTPVIAGDGIIKYNMTIKNTGNKTAYNLITRDTLPYGTYIFDQRF